MEIENSHFLLYSQFSTTVFSKPSLIQQYFALLKKSLEILFKTQPIQK